MEYGFNTLRNAGKNLGKLLSQKDGSSLAGEMLIAACGRADLRKADCTRDSNVFDNFAVLLDAYQSNPEKILSYIRQESADFVTKQIPRISRFVPLNFHLNARLYCLLIKHSANLKYQDLGEDMRSALEELNITLEQSRNEELALNGSRAIYKHLQKRAGQ